MSDARPAIPAQLKRRVLVEAGHRCAIPTCRNIDVDVHHIVPYERCRKHEYENLIAICPNCHRRAHRNDIDAKSLRMYKANLRLMHDKYSQLEIDVLYELEHLPPDQVAQWPPFNVLLLKRILDSGFIQFQKPPHRVRTVGMDITPLFLTMTERGREFLEAVGLRNISEENE